MIKKSVFLLFIVFFVSCKKDNRNAFANAVPLPQIYPLEIVIDSRKIELAATYEWEIEHLEKVASSSPSIRGYGTRYGLANTRFLDVSPFYRTQNTRIGLFFGSEFRGNPNIHLQTSLPLAFEDDSFWGFHDEQSHERYRENLDEYLQHIDENVWVADFTYSRLQESYYWTISKLKHLKSLTLPFHGVDFSSSKLSFPKSLERLVVYNTRIGVNFGDKMKHLTSLKELVFVGCWLDTHATHPHWGNDRFTKLNDPIYSAFDPPVHPFDGIHANLVSLTFVDCDKKLLIATDYYKWPKLKELEIAESFDYPSGDGVSAFHYLKLEPSNSPHIHKDYFSSLSKFTYRNPNFLKKLSDNQIKRIEALQKREPILFEAENTDFEDWTNADEFAFELRRRFENNDFDFEYSIKHLRERSN